MPLPCFLNFSITQPNECVRQRGGLQTVGCHNGRGVLLSRESPEQFKNQATRRGVEIAGGLIRQQNARRMNERARNRNTLHLAAGKLVGIAITEAFEFHPSKPFPCRFARTGLPCKEQRQLDVFKYRQRVQQLERLKNEANFLATQLGQPAIFQRRRGNSVQKHVTPRGKIHRTCQIEQRGFSAAAATY